MEDIKPWKILIACEESQAVCIEMRKRGHEAYSCDLYECSGGHPEWHIQGDMRNVMDQYWDLVIFHPVCRYITNSGVRWLASQTPKPRMEWNEDLQVYVNSERLANLYEGCEFFNLRHQFNSPRVATENPIPHKYGVQKIGKYTQAFQPWHFGHEEMKATCLWLKGLEPLKPTNIVGPPPKDKKERMKWQKIWIAGPGPDREKIRSKTFQGVAQAMAQAWTPDLGNTWNL